MLKIIQRSLCDKRVVAVLIIVFLFSIFFYFRQPRTLEDAIDELDVQTAERILNKEGLNFNANGYPHIVHAFTARPRGYRRIIRNPERRARHRDKIYEMVKLLVEHGADIDQADRRGDTPLLYAIRLDMPNMAQYLLEQGASVKVYNDRLLSPLISAVFSPGNVDIVKMLIKHNAIETINHVDIEGNSALHRAIYSDIVKLLLDHGADPTIRNNAGHTPLEQARRRNWTGKVDILEKYMEADETIGTEPNTFSEN